MDRTPVVSETSRPRSHSSLAVDVSVASQPQRDSLRAVEAFQHAVCSHLAEASVNDASEAVSSAVKKLVAQHDSEVHSLSSENTQLRDQLSHATDIIDSLTQQLRQSVTASSTTTTLHTMLGSSFSQPSAAGTDAAAGTPSSSPPQEARTPQDSSALRSMRSTLGRSEPSGVETQGDDEEHARALATLVEATLPTVEMLTQQPGALEAFVAHYADLRGRVQHLLTEQRLWQHHLAELTPLLRHMTVENADFRQTLTLLRATHVPAEDLHEAIKERDEARTALRMLQLEAARLEHELADAEAQREQQELRHSAERAAMEKSRLSPSRASPGPESATATPTPPPYPHDGQWALAVRELEEQAIVAANQQHLREQLVQAQAETERLQNENAVLRDTLAAAQAEEACVREDAQNAVFRNGVLSQQVTSLLVKVERLRRDLRAATAAGVTAPATAEQPPAPPQPRRRPASASAAHSGSQFGDSTGMATTRVPAQSRRQHTLAWGGVAVASQQLLQDRRRGGSGGVGGAAGVSQGGSSWLLLNGSASVLESAALRGTDGGLQRPVYTDRHPPAPRDALASFSDDARSVTARSGSAPSPYAPAAAMTPHTLEFERGVSRNLRTLGRRTWTRAFSQSGVFADPYLATTATPHDGSDTESRAPHRQRVLTLRNLGSRVMDVSLPCVPRLPASDRLSGVALGRPSAYSVLDPRTGAVARQLSAAEATLLRAPPSPSPDSASHAEEEQAPLALVDESAEDVLAILDMLENEDLGGLERFSANTVSELVLRNQELLVQLYRVTQRAEKAECEARTLACAARGAVPVHAKSLVPSGVGGRLALDERPALHPSRGRRQVDGEDVRGSPASSVSAAGEGEAGRGDLGSGAAARTEPGPAPPLPGHKRTRAATFEGEGDEPDGSEQAEVAGTTRPGFHDEAPLSDRGATLVRQMMDDVLERHDAAVAWEDESVASALIDVLQTMRPLHSRPPQSATHRAIRAKGQYRAGEGDGDEEGEDGDTASTSASSSSQSFMGRADAAVSEAALHSVIQLCAAQAVQLARQELSEHDRRMRAVEQECWSAAQASLQAVVTDLKATFIMPYEERLQAMQTVMQAMYEGRATPHGTHDDRSGLLRVLERLRTLLQAASLKDNAVMTALKASHERQRAFVARRQLKMRRLGGAAPDATHERAEEAEESLGWKADASPLLQPLRTPTTSMPALSQPPAQIGSPVAAESAHEASGFPRSRSPATTRARHQTTAASATAPRTALTHVVDQLLATDSDNDEHEVAYAALRDQLALECAKHRKLSDELQAEKQLYLSLHERMWLLECERDDAVAKLDEATAQMATMLTRDAYETAVGDLDEANQQVDDLKAQLRFLHQEKNRLQMAGEGLQHRLDHQEEERQQAIADSRLALQQREQQLSKAHELEYTLRQEIATLQTALTHREEEARVHLAQVQASERQNVDLADELESLRRQFLSGEGTQALLQKLYPGDTALEANAALVELLRHEKENLAARLAAAELAVEQHKADQDRIKDALQAAIQERQDAELALQAERAAHLGGFEADADDDADRVCCAPPNADSTADEAQDAEGPLPRTVPALRRRVQSLTARLSTATHEIARLREAEAAWKLRETELRRQLDVMSRDPVSRAVRQYGLQACRNFEEALAQLQDKLEAMTASHQIVEAEAGALKADLEAAQASLHSQATQTALLEASKAQAQSELEKTAAQLSDVRDTLAAREAALSAAAEEKAALMKTIHTLEGTVHDTEAARDALKMDLDRTETEKARFWEDNTRLMAKLKEVQQDLTRLDAEKRAANAALAQGMNSASRHPTRRVRAGSAAAARPSLTGDMSMTPTTPSNQRIP